MLFSVGLVHDLELERGECKEIGRSHAHKNQIHVVNNRYARSGDRFEKPRAANLTVRYLSVSLTWRALAVGRWTTRYRTYARPTLQQSDFFDRAGISISEN